MRNVAVVLVAILLTSAAARGADVDVGSINQKLPQKKDLVSPKSDDGITMVGLNETIKGKVPEGEKRNLYVIVNPHSGADWWVQQEVTKKRGIVLRGSTIRRRRQWQRRVLYNSRRRHGQGVVGWEADRASSGRCDLHQGQDREAQVTAYRCRPPTELRWPVRRVVCADCHGRATRRDRDPATCEEQLCRCR